MGQKLDPPVLNITFFDISDTRLYGYNMSSTYVQSWVYQNRTYDEQFITQKGACQTVNGVSSPPYFCPVFASF